MNRLSMESDKMLRDQLKVTCRDIYTAHIELLLVLHVVCKLKALSVPPIRAKGLPVRE